MTKAIESYTPEELQEIGKNAVLARQKQAVKDAEKNEILKKLFAAYQAGTLKLPKE